MTDFVVGTRQSISLLQTLSEDAILFLWRKLLLTDCLCQSDLDLLLQDVFENLDAWIKKKAFIRSLLPLYFSSSPNNGLFHRLELLEQGINKAHRSHVDAIVVGCELWSTVVCPVLKNNVETVEDRLFNHLEALLSLVQVRILRFVLSHHGIPDIFNFCIHFVWFISNELCRMLLLLHSFPHSSFWLIVTDLIFVFMFVGWLDSSRTVDAQTFYLHLQATSLVADAVIQHGSSFLGKDRLD